MTELYFLRQPLWSNSTCAQSVRKLTDILFDLYTCTQALDIIDNTDVVLVG